MLNICSLIQKFFGFVKTIQKKAYRTCVIFVSGAVLFAIISLSAKCFGGSGKNKTDVGNDNTSLQTDSDSDEDDTDCNALLENELFNYELVEDDLNYHGNKKLNQVISILYSDSNNPTQFQVNPTIIPNMNRMVLSRSNISVLNDSIATEQQTTQEVTSTQNVTEEQTTLQETTLQETTSLSTETEATSEETVEIVESNSTNLVNSISDSDYYWLLRIVEAEAGNQDDIGKILIVNVIFNRINSNIFPSTVKGVIFQNNGSTYQFEPVKNGRIYNMTPSQSTIDCVNRALAGEDYSQGALYFTMRTSKYSWFNRSLNLLFVHGDHYFYSN